MFKHATFPKDKNSASRELLPIEADIEELLQRFKKEKQVDEKPLSATQRRIYDIKQKRLSMNTESS